MFDAKIFKKRLREAREKANMRQDEFAQKVGIARASASYYENEKNNSLPNIEVLYRMASVLGVSYNYLMGDDDCINIDIQSVHDLTGLTEKAILKLIQNKLLLANGHIQEGKVYEDAFCNLRIINYLIEKMDETTLLLDIDTYLFLVLYGLNPEDFSKIKDGKSLKGIELQPYIRLLGVTEEVINTRLYIGNDILNEMFLIDIQRDLIVLREQITKKRGMRLITEEQMEGAINGEHHTQEE